MQGNVYKLGDFIVRTGKVRKGAVYRGLALEVSTSSSRISFDARDISTNIKICFSCELVAPTATPAYNQSLSLCICVCTSRPGGVSAFLQSGGRTRHDKRAHFVHR